MFKNILKIVPKFREVSVVSKRYAGHSKWQNIRHIKGVKDAERSALFTKLSRQMKVAITEGGSVDPKFNLKLSQVIDQARRVNMPVATIQSVIKSCQNDKSETKPHMIEIKGPGSCFILCEILTNNLHMFKQNLNTLLKKTNSKVSDGGGSHLFEEKGIIFSDIPPEISSKSEEEIVEYATDHAITSGAEDVKYLEDSIQFICGKTNLNAVVKSLEELKFNITSASVEYIPLKLQVLQDGDMEMCNKLYQKLEAMPEVVRLSDNIA